MPLIRDTTGTRMIPLADLTPHPLNTNVMPDDLLAKLRANIKRTGRYPHLIVRPHPRERGKSEVLDGHHRIRVLRGLGHTEARCDVWAVDDREARHSPSTARAMVWACVCGYVVRSLGAAGTGGNASTTGKAGYIAPGNTLTLGTFRRLVNR